jgi:hypothetical protein
MLHKVLDAWDQAGLRGATIVESTGINRLKRARQVGAPFMSGINRLMSSDEEGHYTIFTIVQNEQMVNECIAASERVVGDLNLPNTGVLAAWPLSMVRGVPDQEQKGETA